MNLASKRQPLSGCDVPKVGDQVGDWTVTGQPTLSKTGRVVLRSKIPCRCKCGTERQVLLRYLLQGNSSGCQKCHAHFAKGRPISSDNPICKKCGVLMTKKYSWTNKSNKNAVFLCQTCNRKKLLTMPLNHEE